ncbi:hypothetical protein C8035_v004788 [Colletotrichum spinosum]|uniref:Uncharacterized protein n=1 Tax=Colletotrichum spinosum TaxID=1347390 RepID=A0A4R8QI13_9PEZI|nr:hypothetical protein C8035_v004788 [Colletotrichum spinosum]
MSRTRVQLVPFDADSPNHAARMVHQRTECGWHADAVPAWQEAQRTGQKCIFWIAIYPLDPDGKSRLAEHISHFPKEREPLNDTASSVRATARTPTRTPFHPVGHISLDAANPATKRLNLPVPSDNLYWIKSLYVSYALQSAGIGRAAMDEVEAMATSPPLDAKVLMLDTVAREDQHRKQFVAQMPGRPPPMSTQEWYARRGYRLVWSEKNFYPDLDRDGKPLGRTTVFMRRDLA